MSRKVILTLAAAATIVAASLVSSAAEARGFGGGGFGGNHFSGHGRTLASVRNPGHSRHLGRPDRPGRPGHPGHWTFHHHRHGHWVFRDGRWIILDEEIGVAPVATPVPGPCTCLTKTYTPDGLVVFADICTKESATAPVAGKAADATEAPSTSNYAGRTYADYLAANPQAASPQTAVPTATDQPVAPASPQNN